VTGSHCRNNWAEVRRHRSAMPTTENHAVSVKRPPTGKENPARSADNAARVSQWIRSQPRPVGVSDVRTAAARALPHGLSSQKVSWRGYLTTTRFDNAVELCQLQLLTTCGANRVARPDAGLVLAATEEIGVPTVTAK